jgi:hypothetical protein
MDAVTFIILVVGFSMISTAIIIQIEEAIIENKEEDDGEVR